MNQQSWVNEAVFYHIFPLGFCGVDHDNDGGRETSVNRLQKIESWLDDLDDLRITAIFLGPVFESSSHGYDTADYYWVDKRLGSNEDLAHLSQEIHKRGMRLILDGVFNHVGRRFWAFRSLLELGQNSPYQDWFVDVRFGQHSPYGDAFQYACWEGHFNLPKLNLSNEAVSQHLLEAVGFWMEKFGIDGLRLDAADCVSPAFWKQLHNFTKAKNSDFWLMGEIIHGDYRQWVNAEQLDSVTNYEAYKGLWSSLNARNYWEIAYTLNRQFGEGGIYRDLLLYNFLDNHDVSRITSVLEKPEHVYLAYILMLCMPGVPSLYYGSELGWAGSKADGDWGLRPDAPDGADLNFEMRSAPLHEAIQRFVQLRKNHSALREGAYRQCFVSGEQFGFIRQNSEESLMILLNMDDHEVSVAPSLPIDFCDKRMFDLLNQQELGIWTSGSSIPVPSTWGRVIIMR